MADLTVFQVLDQVDGKNYFLWDQLTDIEQKQFHPLVLMKWMQSSGVAPTALQRVNLNLFSLSKSQQFLKLVTAGQQKPRKWKWATKTASDNEAVVKAIQFVYDINTRGAQQALLLFSPDELTEITKEYGNYLSDTKKESKKR